MVSKKRKILYLFLLFFLVGEFSYSFLQYYHTSLDGDMAAGIVPAKDVQKIFGDPFGFNTIVKDNPHPNPNRYFSHLFFRDYFRTIPLLVQRFSSPVESIYISCAIIKLLIQILIIYLLAIPISKTTSLFSLNLLTAAALIAPLFQANGYNRYTGIIDKSITYTFFYALPLMLLLLFYVQFYVPIYLKKKNRLGVLSKMSAVLLTVVLPFSGPLIPPVILIVSLLIIIHYYRKANLHFSLKKLFGVFRKIPKKVLLYLGPITTLSIYSLFLGTYNSTYQTDIIPVTERYLRLPAGLYFQFTQKLAFPLLFIFIAANIFFINKHFYTNEGKKIITISKWMGIFALIYILLLPLGGYRPYRPNILRYDTIMPLTICVIYLFGRSSFFLLKNIRTNTFKRIYYPVVIVFLLIFINADRSKLNENNCEKQSLMMISKSKKSIVQLPYNCKVLSWHVITNYEQSKMNAKLLKLWRITDKEKLYYYHSHSDGSIKNH